jgi:thiol-disulfide isomerase/thioredoxin
MIRLAVVLLAAGCSQHMTVRSNPTASASASASSSAARTLDVAGLRAYRVAHRGQPLLVNVFASWCGPCKEELPAIAALADGAPRLQLLGIDTDRTHAELDAIRPSLPKRMEVILQPDGVAPLLAALELPADWNEAFPAGWEATIPLTFLYDDHGAFVTGSVGQLGAEALAEITAAAR